jgi:predicted CXXCH cytochrome family protein
MLKEEQGTLCKSCHIDLEEGLTAAPYKHQPASAGECTQCHSPHKAKLEVLLLAPKTALCLNCHTKVKEKIENERVHWPAENDCLGCHRPHFSDEPAVTTKPLHGLCGECHETDSDSFRKAHIGISAEVMNCNRCHNPHASKDPKLFKDVMHAPFAARSCDPCHIVEQK